MKPRNVILLHADQQRYDSLGCCGNPCALTPNLDRLASEGSVFDRHIAANPVCMPSRASLLTGLYPPGHNVYANGVALNRKDYIHFDDQFASDDIIQEPMTMADMFSAAGYDTSSFGKLHLTPNLSPEEYGYQECWSLMQNGSLDDWHGPYFGFRHVDMTLGHGEQPCHGGHYGAWLRDNHPELLKKVKENAKNGFKPIPGKNDLYPSPVPSELHHSTWLAERFISYLENERPKDKPFFAFVGFPDPHHPFTPSYDIVEKFMDVDVKAPSDADGKGLTSALQKYVGKHSVSDLTDEERKTIIRYTYAMVHQVDMAVGRILDSVEKVGLQDDTIIIFTSDHGDFLCDHQLLYKGTVGSDSLLRVPFILKAPGANLPKRISSPMSNCDAMPTLAALAGIAAPERLHGKDIMKVIQREDEHYAFAFCADGTPESINYTIYDKRHRMTWYPVDGFVDLFDHQTDPGETSNLAEKPGNSDLIETFKNEIKNKLIEYSNPILNRVGAW